SIVVATPSEAEGFETLHMIDARYGVRGCALGDVPAESTPYDFGIPTSLGPIGQVRLFRGVDGISRPDYDLAVFDIHRCGSLVTLPSMPGWVEEPIRVVP